MSRKEQYPGGVKLTEKTARTLAMQEFGTARGLTKSTSFVGAYRPAGTCLQFFSCSFPFLAAVMDRGGDNQLHNGNSDQEDSEFFKHG